MKKNRHNEMWNYYSALCEKLNEFEQKIKVEFEKSVKSLSYETEDKDDFIFHLGLLLFEKPHYAARFSWYEEKAKKETVKKLEKFLIRLQITLPPRPRILATWLDKD
jgi:hypothetical protein